MPNREDILREKTFKDDTDTVSTRVFYTLIDAQVRPKTDIDRQMQLHRTTMAVSLLFEHLHKQGLVTDAALDDILFECAVR